MPNALLITSIPQDSLQIPFFGVSEPMPIRAKGLRTIELVELREALSFTLQWNYMFHPIHPKRIHEGEQAYMRTGVQAYTQTNINRHTTTV